LHADVWMEILGVIMYAESLNKMWVHANLREQDNPSECTASRLGGHARSIEISAANFHHKISEPMREQRAPRYITNQTVSIETRAAFILSAGPSYYYVLLLLLYSGCCCIRNGSIKKLTFHYNIGNTGTPRSIKY